MKILLAMDGSKFSEAALRVVATQLQPQDSQVLLLHAIEPSSWFEQDETLRRRSAYGQELLSAPAQKLQSAGFKNVDARVVEGEPRTAILDAAAEWRPDLIVVGSHGHKGLEKLLLGSVAESLTRHASCSVLIVRL